MNNEFLNNEFAQSLARRSMPVTLDLYTWISVLGMLQLALRHPGVQGSGVAALVEEFGKALEVKLAELIPECAETLAQGWNPIFDEPFTN